MAFERNAKTMKNLSLAQC